MPREERKERTFSLRVEGVPGLLARVESLFRRQRAPIRSFSFEREEGPGGRARLIIVAEASPETFSLLGKQLLRLVDVQEVAEARPAASVPSFSFEEKTA
jgi:acetolactate synthase small subunit